MILRSSRIIEIYAVAMKFCISSLRKSTEDPISVVCTNNRKYKIRNLYTQEKCWMYFSCDECKALDDFDIFIHIHWDAMGMQIQKPDTCR